MKKIFLYDVSARGGHFCKKVKQGGTTVIDRPCKNLTRIKFLQRRFFFMLFKGRESYDYKS